MRKRVKRSFSSCWTCRRRRVGCDGAVPICMSCIKRKVACEGYHVQLAWVDPQTGQYASHTRRTLDSKATWTDWPIYDDNQIDHFIEAHENSDCDCSPLASLRNPFGVIAFKSHHVAVSTPHVLKSISSLDLTPLNNVSAEERSLFHHYIHRVAYLMISIDGAENPWRSTYPALALQGTYPANKSLYHALLAQAAFHRSNLHLAESNLGRRNRRSGLKHYVKALNSLQESLGSATREFDASIATLLTLTMIEGVFAAGFGQWRCHIEGALTVLTHFMQQTPALASSDAWVLSQSLVLMFELAHTSNSYPRSDSNAIEGLLKVVSSLPQFGYTVGASRDVLCSIAAIRNIRSKVAAGVRNIDASESAISILDTLCSEKSDADLPKFLLEYHHGLGVSNGDNKMLIKPAHYLEMLHRRVFRNGAIIYLHRTLLNSTPAVVQKYVDLVLDDTVEILNLNGGTISSWPIFMAAKEACTVDAQIKASRWLEFSCTLGVQNPFALREIKRDVWARRQIRAQLLKVAPDQVIVDWTESQTLLGMDVLLL